MLGVRAACLAPRHVDSTHLRSLCALQPVLNKLYDAVSRDVDFIAEAIRSRMPPCAWQEKELAIFQQTAAHAATSGKPRLLLPNSIYLQPSATRSVLTVGNVQAGEPYHVGVLRGEL